MTNTYLLSHVYLAKPFRIKVLCFVSFLNYSLWYILFTLCGKSGTSIFLRRCALSNAHFLRKLVLIFNAISYSSLLKLLLFIKVNLYANNLQKKKNKVIDFSNEVNILGYSKIE